MDGASQVFEGATSAGTRDLMAAHALGAYITANEGRWSDGQIAEAAWHMADLVMARRTSGDPVMDLMAAHALGSFIASNEERWTDPQIADAAWNAANLAMAKRGVAGRRAGLVAGGTNQAGA